MRSLPNTSTHDHWWELHPSCFFYLGSNVYPHGHMLPWGCLMLITKLRVVYVSVLNSVLLDFFCISQVRCQVQVAHVVKPNFTICKFQS